MAEGFEMAEPFRSVGGPLSRKARSETRVEKDMEVGGLSRYEDENGCEDHSMVSSSLSALGPWDVGKETGAHDKCSGGYSFRIVGQWDSWYGIAWIGCEEGSSTSSR